MLTNKAHHTSNHAYHFIKDPNIHLACISTNLAFSGDTTLESGCSQEHPDLKKKKLYIIIKFFLFVYPLKKKKKEEHPQSK